MLVVLILGLCGLLLLAGAAVLSLFAWHNYRVASRLGLPLSRVGKLRPGFRKVRGKVAALGEPLRSPVTNKECVYYRLRVYEERKKWKNGSAFSGSGGVFTAWAVGGAVGVLIHNAMAAREDEVKRSWDQFLEEVVDLPLLVEDDTGSVQADLHDATILIKEKSRITSDMDRMPPTRLTKLLRDEYGIHPVDERGRVRQFHFWEEVLPLGTKVTVVGTVESLEDGSLRFQKQDDLLLISDRDVTKNGRSSRNQAIGFAAGAGAAALVGLGCFLGAVVLLVKTLHAH